MKTTIRPIELKDATDVQRYAAEEMLARTCNIPHPYPNNGGEWFVNRSIESRQRRERFPSAILVDGEFVGVVGLNGPDFQAFTIEVDYWIGVPHWGKGIGTEAVKLALKIAFSELGMKTVFSGCWEGNPASIRVLEKNGFEEIESIIGSDSYAPKFKDKRIRRFVLTRENWKLRNTEQAHAPGAPLGSGDV